MMMKSSYLCMFDALLIIHAGLIEASNTLHLEVIPRPGKGDLISCFSTLSITKTDVAGEELLGKYEGPEA